MPVTRQLAALSNVRVERGQSIDEYASRAGRVMGRRRCERRHSVKPAARLEPRGDAHARRLSRCGGGAQFPLAPPVRLDRRNLGGVSIHASPDLPNRRVSTLGAAAALLWRRRLAMSSAEAPHTEHRARLGSPHGWERPSLGGWTAARWREATRSVEPAIRLKLEAGI
jgi:hypothetical protein